MREGWKEVSFGEVVQFPPKIKMNKGSKYPFIPMEELSSGIKYVKPVQSKELSGGGAKFENGDTLFARITPCLQNGKIAQAKITGNQPGFGSTEYFIFRGIENVSDSDFVYYLSQTEEFRENAINSMVGASGRQRADAGHVKKFQFLLPPLDTQRKIANILSGYDDLIENNQKRIKILEEMAQQTYEEWFVRMRFPGYESAVFDENGLPKGWEKGTLEKITRYLSGFAFKSTLFKDKGNGVIRIKNIGNNTIDLSDVAYIDDEYALKQNKFLLNAGDLLIAMTGATIGKVGIMPKSNDKFYLNQRVGKFLTDNTAFLNCFFNSTYGLNQVINIAGGAAQPNISAQQILDIELPIPSKEILKKFADNFNNNLKTIINLQSQNQRLRDARDILLPRLMMGMIDVSEGLVQLESVEAKQTDAKVIPLEPLKKEPSKEFKEAVLIACLAERFGSEKFPLGRKRYTKLSYLFHRCSDNKIQDYLRKAAGPYNPKTKYGGPEKIALNSKYIQNWKGDKGTIGFIVAEKIDDARKYFSNYWQIADLDWLVTEFKFKSNDELELLATVDNSLVELSKKNLEFTSSNVMDIIKSEKEWEAKLERTIFSDANVERAIGFLRGVLEY